MTRSYSCNIIYIMQFLFNILSSGNSQCGNRGSVNEFNVILLCQFMCMTIIFTSALQTRSIILPKLPSLSIGGPANN